MHSTQVPRGLAGKEGVLFMVVATGRAAVALQDDVYALGVLKVLETFGVKTRVIKPGEQAKSHEVAIVGWYGPEKGQRRGLKWGFPGCYVRLVPNKPRRLAREEMPYQLRGCATVVYVRNCEPNGAMPPRELVIALCDMALRVQPPLLLR